ncbi:hypothetical protein ABTL95_19595, partial [Acinetobacter baumannii]
PADAPLAAEIETEAALPVAEPADAVAVPEETHEVAAPPAMETPLPEAEPIAVVEPVPEEEPVLDTEPALEAFDEAPQADVEVPLQEPQAAA